jgi:hypothetical protein
MNAVVQHRNAGILLLQLLLCTLILASGHRLKAQIAFTDVVPDTLLDGCCYTSLVPGSILDWDLDGDGQAELRFEAGRYALVDGTDTTFLSRVFVRGLDSTGLAAIPISLCASDSCGSSPIGLNPGDLIDGAMPTTDTAGFLAFSREAPDGSISAGGDWLDGSDRVLGFRSIEGGLPFYGWVRLACPAPDQLILRSWARSMIPNAPIAAGENSSTTAADRASGIVGSDVGEAFDGRDLRIQASPAADESTVAAYRVFAVRGADALTFSIHEANEAAPDRYLELLPDGNPIDTVFGPGAMDSRGVAIGNYKPYRLVVQSLPAGTANAAAISAPSGPVLLQPTGIPLTDLVPDLDIDGCCHPDFSSATLDSLDVNGDGIPELRFRAAWYPALAAPVQFAWAEAGDSASIAVLPGEFCGTDSCLWSPLAFNDGDLLDLSLPMEPEGGYLAALRAEAGDTLRRGQWMDGSSQVLAFRFQAEGLNHWGWVRMRCPEPHRIVLEEYAWNPFPEGLLLAGDAVEAMPAGRATGLNGTDASDLGDGRDFRLSFNAAADESGVAEYRAMAVPLSTVSEFGITAANLVPAGRYLPLAPVGGPIDTVFGALALDVVGDTISDWNLYQAVVLSVAGGSANANALSAPSGIVELSPAGGIGTASFGTWFDLGDAGNGEDLGFQLLPALDERPIQFYGVVAVKADSADGFDLDKALALPPDRFALFEPIGDTIATRLDESSFDADGDAIQEDRLYRLFARTFPRADASLQRALSAPSDSVILRETDVTPIVVVDVAGNEDASDVAVTFFAQPDIDGLEGWRLFLLRASDTALFNLSFAQSLGADRYTRLEPGDATDLVRLDAAQLEASTGVPVFAGFRYVVYVLAELRNPPFPDDVLSGPSPIIELDGGVGMDAIGASDLHFWRYGDRLHWSADPRWQGARCHVWDTQGRELLSTSLDRLQGQQVLAAPGLVWVQVLSAFGERRFQLAP